MAIVGKIIFKLGRKTLSAAQKRALAKAIKASALKRARRSLLKSKGLRRKSVKFAKKSIIRSKRLKSSLRKTNNLLKIRQVSASKYRLKRSIAESKFKNPSIMRKLTGLGSKQAEISFKSADAAFVRYDTRLQKTIAKSSRINKALEAITAKKSRIASKITKQNATTAKLKAEAAKYAKLSGTKIKASDYSIITAQQESVSRSFNNTFNTLIGAKVALVGAAGYSYKKQNPDWNPITGKRSKNS